MLKSGYKPESIPRPLWSSLNRLAHFVSILLVIGLMLEMQQGRGIIFYSTDSPDHNTSQPTGVLQTSGWQWIGQWQHFLGTPIGAHYFITAAHVGGTVGLPLFFRGKNHFTTASFSDPSSDLILWQVREPFSDWAPMNASTDEVGQRLMVFGRGTQRGSEINYPNESPRLRGWGWGPVDGRLRWGQNQVTGFESSQPQEFDDLFYATFDQNGGSNECHLSVGDSGGPSFVQNEGEWVLAGINYAVDGLFNTSTNGNGFNASLFDSSGLYSGSVGAWFQVPFFPRPRPSGFFSTRVSVRLEWIQSIVKQPLVFPPRLMRADSVEGSYIVEPSAQLNQVNQTITLPMTNRIVFVRLESNLQFTIRSSGIIDTNLVVVYTSVSE